MVQGDIRRPLRIRNCGMFAQITVPVGGTVCVWGAVILGGRNGSVIKQNPERVCILMHPAAFSFEFRNVLLGESSFGEGGWRKKGKETGCDFLQMKFLGEGVCACVGGGFF